MNRFIFLQFLPLLLALSPAGAQVTAVLQPSPPFLLPPGDCTWTMTVQGADGSSLPSTGASVSGAKTSPIRQLRLRVVIQKGKVRHQVDTYADGSTSDAWFIDGKYLIQEAGAKGFYLVDPSRDRLGAAYVEEQDYTIVPWLSLLTFVQEENYKGRPCFRYQKNPAPSPRIPAGDPVAATLARMENEPGQAWVEISSKHVAAYATSDRLYTFTYGPAPAEELVPPPKALAWLRKYEEDMNPLHMPMAHSN
jgi:hypothetical protein